MCAGLARGKEMAESLEEIVERLVHLPPEEKEKRAEEVVKAFARRRKEKYA